MRPRPPTMRTKRRYILARILPYGAAVDQKQLYLSVIEAAASLFGDAAVGLAQPAVVYCDAGYAIIRCRRGAERDIAAHPVPARGGEGHRRSACNRHRGRR